MEVPKGKLIAIGGNEDKGTEPEPNEIAGCIVSVGRGGGRAFGAGVSARDAGF